MNSSDYAVLKKNDGGELFLYEPHRQRPGEGKVVLVRQSDGFEAKFTPDRIIHLFVEPDNSAEGYALGKKVYDRCMSIYRGEIEKRHRIYLESKGIHQPRELIWNPTEAKQRHCHHCKSLIAPNWHFLCAKCEWNICTKCGSCGEGYVRKTYVNH